MARDFPRTLSRSRTEALHSRSLLNPVPHRWRGCSSGTPDLIPCRGYWHSSRPRPACRWGRSRVFTGCCRVPEVRNALRPRALPLPRPFLRPLPRWRDRQVAEYMESPVPTPSRPLPQTREGCRSPRPTPQIPLPPSSPPLPRPLPRPFPYGWGRGVAAHPDPPKPPLPARRLSLGPSPASPPHFQSLKPRCPDSFQLP